MNSEVEIKLKKESEILIEYKNSYEKKISLLNSYNADNHLSDEIEIFQEETKKIDKIIEDINKVLNEDSFETLTENELISDYKEISSNFIKNSILIEKLFLENEDETADETTDTSVISNEDNYSIESNDTLLISETLDRVILPYSNQEIKSILEQENKDFKSSDEVIFSRFTRPLSDFKHPWVSRFKETMKLAKRCNFSKMDSITLALEMMHKRFLHPAIIAACRNLDELDVYLDCLDKNELDQFKIFKIKYKFYPVLLRS